MLVVPSLGPKTKVDNQRQNILQESVFAHDSVLLPCILVGKVLSDSALSQPVLTKFDLSPSASSLFHFATEKQKSYKFGTLL